MRNIYRAIVPVHFRAKVKEYQEFQSYKKFRRQEGHVYQGFDETKSIFVHIPKAGGISIIKSLYGEQAGGFGHPTYRRFLKLYGKKRYQEYFKFTIVRNPWDRLHSAYTFLKKGGMNHLDQKFSQEVFKEVATFEDFVIKLLTPELTKTWVHFLPQYTFITNGKGELMVDFVGRFENFESDFEIICRHTGRNNTLAHLNKTQKRAGKSYREFYTSEMKEKVRELYREDIELFNYDF